MIGPLVILAFILHIIFSFNGYTSFGQDRESATLFSLAFTEVKKNIQRKIPITNNIFLFIIHSPII